MTVPQVPAARLFHHFMMEKAARPGKWQAAGKLYWL